LIWKYLQKLPIPKYMEQSVEPLSKVVRDMLEMQKQFPGTTGSARAALETRIAATDRQIDQLVYKLYGLTEEEIGIVEGEA
jgi:hypothetical protein